MSDALPNYKVEQQRIRKNIAEQRANIERQWLEIMEMADRKKRHQENIQASEKAIETYEEQLHQLETTHGQLTHSEKTIAATSLAQED